MRELIKKKIKPSQAAELSETHCQQVMLTLKPGQKFTQKTRQGIDEIIRIIKGRAQILINEFVVPTDNNDSVYIPPSAAHTIYNVGIRPLTLQIMYRFRRPPYHVSFASPKYNKLLRMQH